MSQCPEISHNFPVPEKNIENGISQHPDAFGPVQEKEGTETTPLVAVSEPQLLSTFSPTCKSCGQRVTPAEQGSVLSERQRAALPYVALAPNYSAAARKIGVDRRTIRNWLEDPDFRRAVEEEREKAREGYTTEYEDMREKGLGVIWNSMESRNESVRLRAAHMVLEFYP